MVVIRIVIAPDSFKECLTAAQVARAIASGIRAEIPNAEIVEIPLADGGEGTLEALAGEEGSRMTVCEVSDPLGRRMQASYLSLGDGSAFVEMARASGLELVAPEERDAMRASSRGTGELIAAALESGCSRIMLAVGGSATTDGGTGALRALGFRFRRKDGTEAAEGGIGLGEIDHVDASGVSERVRRTRFVVACDVDNPLCGEDGAAHVYGPQKGAAPQQVVQLDNGLRNFAKLASEYAGFDVSVLKGGGAAGGIAAGFSAFLGAELKPGFQMVAELVKLEERVRGAGLIITGEGEISHQTAHGKVPLGVARLGHRLGIPVVALAGKISGELDPLYSEGLTSAFSIAPGPVSLEYSMKNAHVLLADCARRIIRIYTAGALRR